MCSLLELAYYICNTADFSVEAALDICKVGWRSTQDRTAQAATCCIAPSWRLESLLPLASFRGVAWLQGFHVVVWVRVQVAMLSFRPVAELKEAVRLCSANKEVDDTSAESAKNQLM